MKHPATTSAPVRRFRVLAIAGSLRSQSLNRRLLDAAVTLAPNGMQVEVYDDLASLPMFNEDTESALLNSGAVLALRERVAAADAVLIATPEYNQSIPGVLKNAIDWLSRPAPDEVLVGKPVAVIGASGGRWGTRLAQAALRQVLFATESLVLTGPALYLGGGDAAFDAHGRLVDAAARASLERVLLGLAQLMHLHAAREDADVPVAA
ncbi:NADPH-dependent FMN reductase [Montanilutibacter psychrotolerans]|uniref:NAD(P)H-dependent oxidoreductase n=1 Tax=Montanilutibacter psychrotolerans TaxID=1327343 RepID=A0A3M8SN26_9GAMM|nr:NAD(P)H-dependent oxidoreductase [Lysobacter psychrotolerans]RNF82055.1 NAD(P)H-dependent oxidoreductase [Lysobacter psychrotolerans]